MAFEDSGCYPQWPKVADTVIEAVFAPLADRNLLSGRENLSGSRRVSHAERRSHWETLVSGVRGVFVLASGLSSAVTDKRELTHQNHWGSVSSASSSTHAGVDLVCP